MAQQSIDLLDGFWDRVYEEMHKQNISKLQMAKCCRFDRKTLCRPKKNNRYMRIVYFARLCAELNVSADYLLFGKVGRI